MEPEPAVRLDVWLWRARLCKTRGVAARLVSGGAVRVNAVRTLKPATPVRVGDGLTLVQDGAVRVLRLRGLGTRRGPAAEARLLYDESPPPPHAPGP